MMTTTWGGSSARERGVVDDKTRHPANGKPASSANDRKKKPVASYGHHQSLNRFYLSTEVNDAADYENPNTPRRFYGQVDEQPATSGQMTIPVAYGQY
jgi:hypothetical protein